ncbi:ECF-type riboflavin transporter S component [Natranaerovirga hydrolytica]|uniref:ECF-type riboflavin transporter S component n=1 Tax=Natranaerovirga hydrolytica TaxID=680378 RepID=A0A4R1ML40_9FIRM|nr:ECF transporter S component [Natranaerovirga hydrolytica]TCK90533.1 ECF-type riboflavin transporter S component [Natranaerovirga hydrolytica]
MIQSKTRQLAYTGLMTALVFIATRLITIPIPRGYIHLGDAMIFLTALMLKWKYGAFASGVGSALADLLSPYAIWTLPTLIVKSIMCIIVAFTLQSDKKRFTAISIAFCAIWGSLLIGFRYVIGIQVPKDPSTYIDAVGYRGIENTEELLAFTNTLQNMLVLIAIAFVLAILIIVFRLKKSQGSFEVLKQFVGFSFAGMWMVIGYYITEIILYGHYITPIFSVPFNVIQFLIGILIAQTIFISLKQVKKSN